MKQLVNIFEVLKGQEIRREPDGGYTLTDEQSAQVNAAEAAAEAEIWESLE